MLVWSGIFAILPHEARNSQIMEQGSAKGKGSHIISNLHRHGYSTTTHAHRIFVTSRFAAFHGLKCPSHMCKKFIAIGCYIHIASGACSMVPQCATSTLVLALRKLLPVYQGSPLGDSFQQIILRHLPFLRFFIYHNFQS